MKFKLFVVPQFKGFKEGWLGTQEGLYVLVFPQQYVEQKTGLFGHCCTNLSFAMSDLQYDERKKFLNKLLGAGNWEFELVVFQDEKSFLEKCAACGNDQISMSKMDTLLKEAREDFSDLPWGGTPSFWHR